MLKYILAARALKLFSLSAGTKRFYRLIANEFGGKRRARAGLPASYVERARWILSRFQQYDLFTEGAKYLELGTGWLPWESTVLRLFHPAQITLFDMWDDREFAAFQGYFSGLLAVFDAEIEVRSPSRQAARLLLEKVSAVSSFSELYDLLGFRYVINPAGTLDDLPGGSFEAIFSCNVCEHIRGAILPAYVQDLYRLLKPGGVSIHFIDLNDHLAYYDPGAARKNYLRYSDPVWKLYFENEVQYFNRIQRGEWLGLFARAGFELLEEKSQSEPLRIRVNQQYACLSPDDLECTALEIVHRKPFQTPG